MRNGIKFVKEDITGMSPYELKKIEAPFFGIDMNHMVHSSCRKISKNEFDQAVKKPGLYGI